MRSAFTQGLMSNVLNPKVAIFYVAFLPQFISPGDAVLLKSVLLASIHNLLSLLWLGAVVLAVARGRDLMRHPRAQRALGWVSGTVLIALGLRLALQQR